MYIYNCCGNKIPVEIIKCVFSSVAPTQQSCLRDFYNSGKGCPILKRFYSPLPFFFTSNNN